ncbi:MAG: hypothetical protein JOZ98_21820, partial [Solirubrobacterales bacterium]|nr:hypothetical protein [Solirubrobacterales bacterium]
DPRAWAHALEHLWRDPERRQTRGSDALERARALFSQERYFNDLMSVYQS